jgi:hypothetical protein
MGGYMETIIALNSIFSKNIIIITISLVIIFSSPSNALFAQSSSEVGTITIITHVINDNGGSKQASDFSNCVDSSSLGSKRVQCSSGHEQGNSVSTIHTGAYKVVEDPKTPHTGYAVSYSTGCSGTISLGSKNNCTVTYNDVPPAPLTSPGGGNPITIFSLPKIFG